MPETGGTVQLVTSLGTLTFNSYTSQNFLKLDAFELHRAVRLSQDNAPQRDGAILAATAYRGNVNVMMRCTLWASNLITRATMMDTIMGYVNSTLNTPGTLIWTPFGQAARQLTVRMLDYPTEDNTDNLYKSFTFTLVSEDAIALAQILQQADTAPLQTPNQTAAWEFGTQTPTLTWEFGTATPTLTWQFGTDPGAGGGGYVTVNNAGNAPTWPTIRIFGTTSGPLIKNFSTGDVVSLPSYSIPTGAFVDIDMKKQTILLNGNPALSLLSQLDTAASNFFTIAPGLTNLRLSATSFDGTTKATVFWRDAWA